MTTFLFIDLPNTPPCFIISGKDASDAYKKLRKIQKINRGLMIPSDVCHFMGSYDEGSYFDPPV